MQRHDIHDNTIYRTCDECELLYRVCTLIYNKYNVVYRLDIIFDDEFVSTTLHQSFDTFF